MTDLYLHWDDPATGCPRSRVVTDGLRIGAADGPADVRVRASGLNALHAEIRLLPDGRCLVAAMGSSRVLVGDDVVTRCEVVPGSVLQLGTLALRFASTGTRASGNVEAPRPALARPNPRPPRPGTAASSGRTAVRASLAAAAVLLAVAAAYLALREKAPAAGAAVPAAAVGLAAARPSPAPPPTAAPADPFGRARGSVVTIIAKSSFEEGYSTGTGFFVDARGRLVTNYHVVRQTDYQQILLPGSRDPVDARIISEDPEADLALLQAYVTPPTPVAPMIPISTELRMGDTVYALGSPAGPELAVSLSKGIVSTDGPRKFGDRSFIQHDAAVNPGNSGGPLLNLRGEVVGLNVAKVKGAEGLSFAIPIEDVRRFIETAR